METEQQSSLFDDAEEGNLAIRRGDKWFGLVPISDEIVEIEEANAPLAPLAQVESSAISDIGGKRSLGPVTSVHVRLQRAQWQAARAFALSQNTSVQGLIIYALDRVFKEHGKPFANLSEKMDMEVEIH